MADALTSLSRVFFASPSAPGSNVAFKRERRGGAQNAETGRGHRPLQTVAQDTANREVRPDEVPADCGSGEETGMGVRGVISQKAVSGERERQKCRMPTTRPFVSCPFGKGCVGADIGFENYPECALSSVACRPASTASLRASLWRSTASLPLSTHSAAVCMNSVPRSLRYSLPSLAPSLIRLRVSSPDFGANRTPTARPAPKPKTKLDTLSRFSTRLISRIPTPTTRGIAGASA